MSDYPEPPNSFKHKCSFCNNPEGGFWVIPPTNLHIKANSNEKSSYDLTKTIKMTIECPNPICGKVNTIFWDKA